MRKASAILAAAALWACAAPSGTGAPDPAAAIRQLYQGYIGSGDYSAYETAPWTDETRAAIAAMEARSEALQAPILDYDPMVGAQEHEVSAVNVRTIAPPANGRAVVEARFINGGRDTILLYDLLLVGGAWRIDNIRDECGDLRAILAARNEEELHAAANGDCPP